MGNGRKTDLCVCVYCIFTYSYFYSLYSCQSFYFANGLWSRLQIIWCVKIVLQSAEFDLYASALTSAMLCTPNHIFAYDSKTNKGISIKLGTHISSTCLL
jgi:hypothetical protein